MTARLLIVDDHRLLIEGIRLLIEAEGFKVVGEAASGREAVELASSVAHDVVIMDLGMKDLNGVEATRILRANRPTVPVVVLSGFADRSYVLRALEAGASAYVVKISAHTELVAAIRAVMAGHSFLSPEITGIVLKAGVSRAQTEFSSIDDQLSGREREILQLVAEGSTSGQIASTLNVGTRTVEQHRRNIMEKLQLHSVAELTQYAIRVGIIFLDV
jgi:DNA-binding NarL/FixJ family response regulator